MYYNDRSWRRRSPSPVTRSGRISAQGSAATSRISSPPIPSSDRLNVPPSGSSSRSPAFPTLRTQAEPLSANTIAYRKRSPTRKPEQNDVFQSPARPASPLRAPAKRSSPPKTSEASPRLDVGRDGQSTWIAETPTGPRSPLRREPQRLGQTPRSQSFQAQGPNTYQISPSISPPTGPASKQTVPQSRVGTMSLLSAPTRPKGGPNSTSFRSDGNWSGQVRRGPSSSYPITHPTSLIIPPTGPRNNGYSSTSPIYDPHKPPSFRQSSTSSSSTPYHRAQRFSSYLVGISNIVPGGKLLPSNTDPSTEKRLSQLETDKEKLLGQISEKQKNKRSGLRDWERLSRESATGALRSELAEGHLQRMTDGDGIGGSAF